MAIRNIEPPKDFVSFMNGASKAEIVRAEQLLNALQNLKVQVTVNGTSQVVTGTIQISGDSAILQITL